MWHGIVYAKIMYRAVQNTWKRFWASLTLLSVDVLIILGLFLISLIAFVWIAKYVFLDNKTAFDEAAFKLMAGWVSDINTDVMRAFTLLGTLEFLLPAHIILTLWFLFVRKHRWYTIQVPVIGLSSALIMVGLKNIFGRERPVIPLLEAVGGLGFPSGHALCSMTFYGLIIYFLWHRIKHLFWRWAMAFIISVVILVIGISRVYLRVHHASDVIAGFALGLIWLVISLKLLQRIENYSKKKIPPEIGNCEVPTIESNMKQAG